MGCSNSRVIATGRKTGATRSPQKLQAILVAPETVAQISEYQSPLTSIGSSGPRSPRPDCPTFSWAAFVKQPACGRLSNTRVLNGPGRIRKLAGGASDAETYVGILASQIGSAEILFQATTLYCPPGNNSLNCHFSRSHLVCSVDPLVQIGQVLFSRLRDRSISLSKGLL